MSHRTCLEPVPKTQPPGSWTLVLSLSPLATTVSSCLFLSSGLWSVQPVGLVIFNTHALAVSILGWQFRPFLLGSWHLAHNQVNDGDNSEHVLGTHYRQALC